MGNRILRRGNVAALIQAFENVVDEEKAERDAVRMLKGHFDLNDFSEQVHRLEKMGPLTETAETIRGLAEALPDGAEIDDGEFDRIGAMVSSMTEDERRYPERFVVTSSEAIVEHNTGKKPGTIAYDAAYDIRRLRRVAQGSGRPVHEVVDLLNRFALMRQMMIQIGQSSVLFAGNIGSAMDLKC
jgi:signal recognition particle subunit SRP54